MIKMKRILLILTLVLFTTTITEAQKIKDVNGVKIPKGYSATYDGLDDRLLVTQKNNRFANDNGKNIFDLRFIIKGNIITPYVDLQYIETQNISITSSTMCIKNKGDEIHRYDSIWENKLYSSYNTMIFIDGSLVTSTYHIEQDTFDNNELNNFIMENLNSKSKVTIRFHGSKSVNNKIRTKYVKELASAVEFYKKVLTSFE